MDSENARDTSQVSFAARTSEERRACDCVDADLNSATRSVAAAAAAAAENRFRVGQCWRRGGVPPYER